MGPDLGFSLFATKVSSVVGVECMYVGLKNVTPYFVLSAIIYLLSGLSGSSKYRIKSILIILHDFKVLRERQ